MADFPGNSNQYTSPSSTDHVTTTIPATELPRKSKRHRKRHVPVGPAGVWFQNFHQSSSSAKSSHAQPKQPSAGPRRSKNRTSNDDQFNSDNDEDERNDNDHDENNNNNNNNDDDDEEEDLQDAWQSIRRSVQRRSVHTNAVSSFSSPAWIAMQCDSRWVTPSFPSHLMTVEERYHYIRPHVPAQFTMIHELLMGMTRPKNGNDNSNSNNNQNSNASRQPWFCDHLMVLVTNIHGGTTDHGWTVVLTDETGATITAWIQPASVRRQLQRPTSVVDNQSHIRPWFNTGCVWWLRNTTLLLSPEASETGMRSLSFLLLVSEENIHQVWTPNDGESLSDEAYIHWMEQRSQMSPQDWGDADNQKLLFKQRRTQSPKGSAASSPHPSQCERALTQSSFSQMKLLHMAEREIGKSADSPFSHRQVEETVLAHLRPSPNHFNSRGNLRGPTASQHVENSQSATQLQSLPSTRDQGLHSDSRESQLPLRTQPTNSWSSRSTWLPYDSATEATIRNSQEITTASASNSANLLTLTASPGHPKKGGHVTSPFAEFAYAAQSQGEATHTRGGHSARKPITTISNSGQEKSPKIDKSHEDATTNETTTGRKSTPKSAGSNTSCTTSGKGRKRKSRNSRLWTACDEEFDFSDDDSDDEDHGDKNFDIGNGLLGFSKLAQQSDLTGKQTTAMRSLFHSDTLRDLANLLSSDDEDEE